MNNKSSLIDIRRKMRRKNKPHLHQHIDGRWSLDDGLGTTVCGLARDHRYLGSSSDADRARKKRERQNRHRAQRTRRAA